MNVKTYVTGNPTSLAEILSANCIRKEDPMSQENDDVTIIDIAGKGKNEEWN